MNFEDEKDYLMRIIKEMVSILVSVFLGKQYHSVKLPAENKAIISGKKLTDYLDMADQGYINEAENELLENIDYADTEQVCAMIAFYEHLTSFQEDFLNDHNYSTQEILEGLKNIASRTGYGSLTDALMEPTCNAED